MSLAGVQNPFFQRHYHPFLMITSIWNWYNIMKINQISEKDWNEIANPFDIAIIPLLPIEFKQKYKIQPFEYDEDELGRCTSFNRWLQVLE